MNSVQRSLVREELTGLLKKGAVVESTSRGFISSIFLVPKKTPGTWRPIINLRALNRCLVHRHFKMEGIMTVSHAVRRDDWLAKVDLKDAYFTIPIFEGHRRFLQFQWGKGRLEFVCLPFGLSQAPWVFTKLLRVVVASLRKRGFRLVIYLDDIHIIGSSEWEPRDTLARVAGLLTGLEFIISTENSVLDPAQSLEYIGLVIDTLSMNFTLSKKKRAGLTRLCREALSAKKMSLRTIARIIGTVNWAVTAVKYAQGHFRSLQALYIMELQRSGGFLDADAVLSEDARDDLRWWLTRADFKSCCPLIAPSPDVTISSDASLTGWGAVCYDVKTGGPWVSSERDLHINSLELMAALRALQCFTSGLRDSMVESLIDNTSAVSYINKLGGTRSDALCAVALEIIDWCESRSLSLHAVYTPSKANFFGRRRVEETGVIQGLEAPPTAVQINSEDMEVQSGPVRQQLEQPFATVPQLVSTAGSGGSRCFLDQLERSPGVLLPPIQSDPVLPVQTGEGPGISRPSEPLLAQSIVVPDDHVDGSGHSSSSTPKTGPAGLSVGRVSSSNYGRFVTANRLETLGSCLGEQGLSPTAVELLLGATRANTHAAYQSSWGAWRNWYAGRNCDPLSAGGPLVLEFLAEYSKAGNSYSTVNVARSMLSSTLTLSPGSQNVVGKNPLVVMLMKGIYNSNPTAPRYSATWDPAVVLSHFDATAGSDLSLLQLARKSVTLLALTTLLRSSEIASIKLDSSIRITETEMSFSLGKPRKAQHTGGLHTVSVPSWPDNPVICPVACVESYLLHTEPLRSGIRDGTLFIGSNRPHRSVTSSTDDHWIKDQLKEAGIDTTIYSAHSARGAGASKAASTGVPVQTILSQGHWARESTFARFYRRDVTVDSNQVGQSVLRGRPRDNTVYVSALKPLIYLVTLFLGSVFNRAIPH